MGWQWSQNGEMLESPLTSPSPSPSPSVRRPPCALTSLSARGHVTLLWYRVGICEQVRAWPTGCSSFVPAEGSGDKGKRKGGLHCVPDKRKGGSCRTRGQAAVRKPWPTYRLVSQSHPAVHHLLLKSSTWRGVGRCPRKGESSSWRGWRRCQSWCKFGLSKGLLADRSWWMAPCVYGWPET